MEQLLFDAATTGNDDKVREILRVCPEVDVNWRNGFGSSALHKAALKGSSNVIALLLAHPNIDVNPLNEHGYTPLLLSCIHGHSACVRKLLEDPRAIVRAPYGGSPLLLAAREGHVGVVEQWICSGRDIDPRIKGELSKDSVKEALRLLWDYFQKPAEVRLQVQRRAKGNADAAAAYIFALVVFVCDGLLEIRRLREKEVPELVFFKAVRFINLIRRLPMELQMIVAHRVIESGRHFVTVGEAEAAFQTLARFYQPDRPPTVLQAWWRRLSSLAIHSAH